MARKAFAVLVALATAIAIACAGTMAATTTALAEDYEYYVTFKNQQVDYTNNFCGYPGDKLVIQPTLYSMEDGSKASDVTFKWTCDTALNASTSATKATIKKLPKVGTYKLTMKAYDADGNKIYGAKYKVVVKKKVPLTLTTQTLKSGEGLSKNTKTLKKSQSFVFTLKGVSWGWNNNKKQPFYKWTVKHVKSGKSVTWSTKKGLKKNNALIKPPEYGIGGATYPMTMGTFKKTGKYKITATVYHNDKVAVTKTKTITVK